MFTRIAAVAALTAGLALLIGFIGIRLSDLNINEVTVPVFYATALIGLVGVHLRQVAQGGILLFAAAWGGIGLSLLSVQRGEAAGAILHR